jgi:hypothetical protein
MYGTPLFFYIFSLKNVDNIPKKVYNKNMKGEQ